MVKISESKTKYIYLISFITFEGTYIEGVVIVAYSELDVVARLNTWCLDVQNIESVERIGTAVDHISPGVVLGTLGE